VVIVDISAQRGSVARRLSLLVVAGAVGCSSLLVAVPAGAVASVPPAVVGTLDEVAQPAPADQRLRPAPVESITREASPALRIEPVSVPKSVRRQVGRLAGAVTFTIDSAKDDRDAVPGDGVCATSASSGGACTLRAAIEESNADRTREYTFAFAIGSGPVDIDAGILPAILATVRIDGTTQPGYVGSPLVQLQGTGGTSSSGGTGLALYGSGSTVAGLAVTDYQFGIVVAGDGVTLIDNHIGLDNTGTPTGNFIGIRVTGADDTQVGYPGHGNLITGNDATGLRVDSAAERTVIQANEFGTTPDGEVVFRPHNAIKLDRVVDTLIGGESASAGNVVNGAGTDQVNATGVLLEAAPWTRILHNIVGLDATGRVKVGAQGKRHGMIKRTAKFVRSARGTMVLGDSDARIVKKYMPYAR